MLLRVGSVCCRCCRCRRLYAVCYSVCRRLWSVGSVCRRRWRYEGDAPCATRCAGCCGGWALFAVGVGGGGGYTLCASLYAGGCGVWALFAGGVGGTEVLR